ncbi:hypothetical protein MHBO_000274 [Bonamia ostreae]|uniref:C2H2-type domain-containing protein n=1 Tax=Bonamia ostreae TaxID=126728 RepID=A0ABV2AF69_9EUKA
MKIQNFSPLFMAESDLIVKKEKSLECNLCRKKFKFSSRLKNHFQSHTNVQYRKIVTCTYLGCNRTYTKRSNLNIHIKSHHLRKNYRCVLCGKIYKFKQSLQRHREKNHRFGNSDIVKKQTNSFISEFVGKNQ